MHRRCTHRRRRRARGSTMRCSMRCTRKSSSSRYCGSRCSIATAGFCTLAQHGGQVLHRALYRGACTLNFEWCSKGQCARLNHWVLLLQGLIQKYKSARVFDFASEQIAERYDGRTSPGGPGREHALGWINIVAQPTEVAANHGGGVVQRGRGSLPGTNVQPVQEKGHTNSQTCHVGFFVVLRFSALMWVPMCVSVCLSLSWGRRTRPSAKRSTSTSFSNARRRSSEYPAPSSVVFAVC